MEVKPPGRLEFLLATRAIRDVVAVVLCLTRDRNPQETKRRQPGTRTTHGNFSLASVTDFSAKITWEL